MSARNSRGTGRVSWIAIAVLASLASTGCSGVLGPETDDLEAARSLWASTAPASYSFVFQRMCFCTPETVRPMRIEVDGQQILDARYVDNGEPVTAPFLVIPTIETLFAEIEDAIAREAHLIEVDYDPEYGFPNDSWIDYEEFAVDEEMGFAVTEFLLTALPLPGS